MKLHLATSKKDNFRKHLEFIQIKNGNIYATNCHILARIPVQDLFKNEFSKEDEYYIHSEDWKKQGFYKLTDFKKNGNLLEGYDNKWNLVGIIKMKNKEEFDNIGRFPDCESVIYKDDRQTEQVEKISFNPSLFLDLAEALGEPLNQLTLSFYGIYKAIKVSPKNSQKVGILMPIDITRES